MFFWGRRRIHGSRREGGPLVSLDKETTQEGSEEVKGAENEKQGSKMQVDDVTPGMQRFSKETDGDFFLCEVEEQQEARVEIQGQTRVIRVESKETWNYVSGSLAHQEISQEETKEIGFVLKVDLEELFFGVTTDAAIKP